MKVRFAYFVGLIVIALIALHLSDRAQGDSNNSPTVLRANRIELTDENGQVLATLSGMSMKGDFVAVTLQFRDACRPALTLYKLGSSRVSFSTSTENGTLFRVSLADNEGSQFSLSNENDKYSMTMGLLDKDVPLWNLRSGDQVRDLNK